MATKIFVNLPVKGLKRSMSFVRRTSMRYLCLGYHDENTWTTMSESERDAMLQECSAYEEVLRKSGYFIDGKALQGVQTATTLRFRGGKMTVTDGPFAETKEQLGGVMVLEARDLNHAIQLMSYLPCMQIGGCLEIRPINEEITQGHPAGGATFASNNTRR